jgi:hypothetical protein
MMASKARIRWALPALGRSPSVIVAWVAGVSSLRAIVMPDPDVGEPRVTVQLVHESNPEPLVIGDNPLEDVVEPPQG